VRRLFLTEGLLLGGVGALLGLIIAGALTQLLATHGGIQLPPPPGTTEKLFVIPQMDPVMSVLGVVMPALVGVLAAWWPASRSANLSPVAALTEA
jgi:putative ABC transport system permease protein